MPEYAWTGRSRDGKRVGGVETGTSRDAVVSALRARSVWVTAAKERGREIALPRLARGVPAQQLAVFTRQLSVMIDAGLPLVQALELLGSQQENPTLGKVLLRVRQDVESGQSLSEALRRHPDVFDDLYANMVAAGEAGGILDVILQRLATHIEKAARLRSQVRSAMVYPIAVLTIAALVVWVILWKVIPTFAELFAGLGAPLPVPTLVVVWASAFLLRYGIFVIAGLALGLFALRSFHGTHHGRRVLDGLLLRVPIVGLLFRKIAVARFCRTLATLTTSGVPILDALDITARTAGNAVVEDAILATRTAIAEGRTIAEPLRATAVFPPIVTGMIRVGEETGALDAMLAKIADFYESEVDLAVEGLLALLEPVMIALLGVVIGGIVIAMYLPIFEIVNTL